MIKDGFTINECDKYVYTKTVGNAYITVRLYIDNMLILGTNIEVLMSMKRMLSNNFLEALFSSRLYEKTSSKNTSSFDSITMFT